jgi:hypothetical protein
MAPIIGRRCPVPRSLTAKQQQFAAEIAMGAGKTEAYRRAYAPANGRAPSVYSNAKRVAKLPQIAAAVAELRLRYMPAEADMEALYRHGLATMVDLTNSSDPRMRLAAATWLCREAAEHRRAASDTAAEEQQSLHEKLRALYRNIEEHPLSGEQLVMEIDEGDENLQCTRQMPVEQWSVPLATDGSPESPSPGEQPGPEPSAGQPTYELVPIPGRHPPEFKRIRLR